MAGSKKNSGEIIRTHPYKPKDKRAIVSVINDLSTDQRVARTCSSLQTQGYAVKLIGRRLKNSLPLSSRDYKCYRMKLFFTQGPLFYFCFQWRLFWWLLWQARADVYFANDLDTLFPMFLIARLKHAAIVYDSHELFTEVPELLNSPIKQRLWLYLEGFLVPKVDAMISVNNSIAHIFSQKYKRTVFVVRNIPVYTKPEKQHSKAELRQWLHLPMNKFIIILQGAGINMHRGAEEALKAMQYIDNTLLLIVGSGDVIEHLKRMRLQLKLEDKVLITGKVPYQSLKQYTQAADLGISFDKDTNLNYRYSLPNKLFDYIHAGIPVLATQLVEVENIINQYNIGLCIKEAVPLKIAETINNIIKDNTQYQDWKTNLTKAQKKLNWQQEEIQLIKCMESLQE